MNETLSKFGYPESVIFETEHWAVLIRPKQLTLGSAILCTKHEVASLSEMPLEALCELKTVSGKLERTLRESFSNEKINYIALMMVDKEFHWHVIPRYSKDVEIYGVDFKDTGWPKYPDLSYKNEISGDIKDKIKETLINNLD